MGRKKSKTYTPEFKQSAVLRALTEDCPIAEVARDLGIKPHRLYQWRSEYLAREGPDALPPALNPDLEIERLRSENARLRQERDFLKKAAAFFAQNPA